MNWLIQLLTEDSVARTVILLGVAGAAGSALGKIRVGGVSLGWPGCCSWGCSWVISG